MPWLPLRPFASFCQKVLIALYDADVPFIGRSQIPDFPRRRPSGAEPGGGGRPGEPAAGDHGVPAHPEPTVRKRIASAESPGPNARAQPRCPARPAPSSAQHEHHRRRAHIAVLAQHRAALRQRRWPAAGHPAPRPARCARPDAPPKGPSRRRRPVEHRCRSGAAGPRHGCPARHREPHRNPHCRSAK